MRIARNTILMRDSESAPAAIGDQPVARSFRHGARFGFTAVGEAGWTMLAGQGAGHESADIAARLHAGGVFDFSVRGRSRSHRPSG